MDGTCTPVDDRHIRGIGVARYAQLQGTHTQDAADTYTVGMRGRILDTHRDITHIDVVLDDIVFFVVAALLLETDDTAGSLPVVVRIGLVQDHRTLVGATGNLTTRVHHTQDTADTDHLLVIGRNGTIVDRSRQLATLVHGTHDTADTHPCGRSNFLDIGHIAVIDKFIEDSRHIGATDDTAHHHNFRNFDTHRQVGIVGAIQHLGTSCRDITQDTTEGGLHHNGSGGLDRRMVGAVLDDGRTRLRAAGRTDQATDAELALGTFASREDDLGERMDIVQEAIVHGHQTGAGTTLALGCGDFTHTIITLAILGTEGHILDGTGVAQEETRRSGIGRYLEVVDLVVLAIEYATVRRYRLDGGTAKVDVVIDFRFIECGERRSQLQEGLEVVSVVDGRSRRNRTGRSGLGDGNLGRFAAFDANGNLTATGRFLDRILRHGEGHRLGGPGS